jgi:hypothetical protein
MVLDGMAKLDSQKSNFVVVGAWNPAIIQPEWLRKEFPEVVPETIGIEIIGPPISIRFDIGDFFLEPLNGRLIFSAKEVNEKTLDSISELSNGIADRLMYTPVSAAGCNFCFSLESKEKFCHDGLEEDGNTKDLADILAGSIIVSRSIQHTYSLDDHNVNIFYDHKGNEKALRINFEYQSPQTAMTEASNMLQKNFETALKLSNQLITKT